MGTSSKNGIYDYSTTAADNDGTTAAGDAGMAEGISPASVNDKYRQALADMADVYLNDTLQWVDRNDTPTRTGNTTFTVPGDQTAYYTVGRRIKLNDSSVLYGTITISAYTSLTTVTVSVDGGTALSASLDRVWIGSINPTNTSLPVISSTPNHNILNNGGFESWQLGTSFTPSSSTVTHLADCWGYYRAAANVTVSQDTTNFTANGLYGMKVQRDSGTTDTNAIYVDQALETEKVADHRGEYLTLSFDAIVGANFSPSSNTVAIDIFAGTGTETYRLATAFTSETTLVSTTKSLTTSKVRYKVTTTTVIPSNATQLSVLFSWNPVGTAGANDWVSFGKVKLEKGATETDWLHQDPSEVLRNCMRHVFVKACGTGIPLSLFRTSAASNKSVTVDFPVRMRASPTVTATLSSSSPTVDTKSTDMAVIVSDDTSTTQLIDLTALTADASFYV